MKRFFRLVDYSEKPKKVFSKLPFQILSEEMLKSRSERCFVCLIFAHFSFLGNFHDSINLTVKWKQVYNQHKSRNIFGSKKLKNRFASESFKIIFVYEIDFCLLAGICKFQSKESKNEVL